MTRVAGASRMVSRGRLHEAVSRYDHTRPNTDVVILEPYEGWGDAGYITDIGFPFFWHPSYAPVRKLERFKAYARKAGFVDYWRAKGWPDLCRPVGADDFVCD
jgi:hypothetical protein